MMRWWRRPEGGLDRKGIAILVGAISVGFALAVLLHIATILLVFSYGGMGWYLWRSRRLRQGQLTAEQRAESRETGRLLARGGYILLGMLLVPVLAAVAFGLAARR